MSSSPVPLKTRRVGQRSTLNLSRAETSSLWCGVKVRRGVPAQVSSTSLDHGSKLRGPTLNVERLMRIKSVKAQNPSIGVEEEFGEGGAGSGVILITGPWFKIPRFAL
ncbi:hypothetical protein TNCV_653081 [Trichonephila clavipes]|nr:hypothetical protein TNCV_653081 [Trichonephila clavipes]